MAQDDTVDNESPSTGTEASTTSDDQVSGVPIPEQFQKDAVSLIESCDSQECLDFLQDLVEKKSQEYQGGAGEGEGLSDTQAIPTQYSDEGMPS